MLYKNIPDSIKDCERSQQQLKVILELLKWSEMSVYKQQVDDILKNDKGFNTAYIKIFELFCKDNIL